MKTRTKREIEHAAVYLGFSILAGVTAFVAAALVLIAIPFLVVYRCVRGGQR